MTVEVWSRFWGWSLVEISMLNIGQDFEAGLWSTFDKTLGGFFGETKNRSDRKGDLCCSALPRLKPTLEPKRLLPFNFFTGLKFFFKLYEIGLLCSSLKKTSFPLQLQKVRTRRKITFHFFVQQICFSMSICPCICLTIMKRKEQTPSRVFCMVHLRQLFPTRLEANHVWTGF